MISLLLVFFPRVQIFSLLVKRKIYSKVHSSYTLALTNPYITLTIHIQSKEFLSPLIINDYFYKPDMNWWVMCLLCPDSRYYQLKPMHSLRDVPTWHNILLWCLFIVNQKSKMNTTDSDRKTLYLMGFFIL